METLNKKNMRNKDKEEEEEEYEYDLCTYSRIAPQRAFNKKKY